jgi:hypothetical protein
MATPRVLYCHCAFAQVVPKDVKTRVLEDLTASSCSFDAVPDLCEMSARRDPALAQIAAGGATIVACYPRAVKWLFSAAATPLPDDARILNMREQTAEVVISELNLRQGSEQALNEGRRADSEPRAAQGEAASI